MRRRVKDVMTTRVVTVGKETSFVCLLKDARISAVPLVAADLMSSPPVTVRLGTTVAEAARLAAGESVERLPVVDDRGRLVGAISCGDLLKVFLRPDEEILREVAEAIQPGTWSNPMILDVAITNGVVSLRGQVQRRSSIALLVRAAEDVEGVVRVECELGWDMDDTGPCQGPPSQLLLVVSDSCEA